MLTRRLKHDFNKSHHEKRVPYEFRTSSEPNGPVIYNRIPRNGDRSSAYRPYTLKVRQAKPYMSAVANGTVKTLDNKHELTNSEILYEVMTASQLELGQVATLAPIAKAVNGAIGSSQKYGDLLLLVSVAEAKKTKKMVESIFVRLYKLIFNLYKAVKDLDPVEAYKLISNAWLEYRYGWTPLMMELKALKLHFEDSKQFQVRSAYGTALFENIDFSFERYFELSSDNHNFSGEYKVTINEVRHKTGFNYLNKDSSKNVDNMAVLGLNIDSLLNTALELIPFSFILEMFINIGDSLTAMDFKNEVEPFNGYLTTIYNVTVESKGEADRYYSQDKSYWFEYTDELKDWESYRSYWEHTLDYNHNEYGEPRRGFTFMSFPDLAIGEPITSLPLGRWVTWPNEDGYLFIHSLFRNSNHQYYKTIRIHGLDKDGNNHSTLGYMIDNRPPMWIFKEFFSEPINHTEHANRALSAYHRLAEETDGSLLVPYGTAGKSYGFSHYCELRGIYPGGLVVNRDSDGNLIYRRTRETNRKYPDMIVGDLSKLPPVYQWDFRRKATSKPVQFSNKFTGEFMTRTLKDDFEFSLLAEIDLSKSQMADLLIFSERLVTALRK